MRVSLDMAGVHAVTAEPTSSGVALALVHEGGDRRSTTHEALLRALRVRAGGAEHALDPRTGSLAVAPCSSLSILLRDGAGAPLSVATLGVDASGELHLHDDEPRYTLSPFELRYAADNGALHPVRLGARTSGRARAPRTDLHTHFAGCVSSRDLVRLGEAHDVRYPTALLGEAGIRADGEAPPLSMLGSEIREALARRLEVPLDRRVTFRQMEQIYRLRAPLTKARELFVPLCARIAADYANMGVTHVELSLGSVVEAEVLRAIHREVPRIERESGVTVRFLAAISRHDDPEWDRDLVDRIKTLAGSVYVAGVDVMGQETNSTSAFAPVLEAIASWADTARPGFVVRVHAGESPSHPENVRLALEALAGHDVTARIGHGLYGVDDATLERIVATGAIVEFNLDSNVALNHLQSARAVPIRRYVEAGARVVLGSDGYGIYQTSPEAAARAALLAGLDPSHLEGALAETERAYVARARERDAALLSGAVTFVVPDDAPPVHFTPEVTKRKEAAIAARDAALSSRLAEIGAPALDASRVAELVGSSGMLVSVAGAWSKSWNTMPEATRARVTRELELLVDGLDAGTVLVTGGTALGVEGIVGRRAKARGLPVLAALVRETPPSALAASALTHATIVGESLYDKASGLYDLVLRHRGVCLFVGGGQIVSDEIQVARNLRLRYLLMAGVSGASDRHAAESPARAFETAEQALFAMRALRESASSHAPLWFVGPNPTADAVVLRVVDGVREVLLVRRDLDAPAEAGEWALPGGFVRTRARRGEVWSPDVESPASACARELAEESGVRLDPSSLVEIGVFEGGARDPRDTAVSWSRSTAFVAVLGGEAARAPLAGGDDAADARWFAVDDLPRLAFDHARIVAAALAALARGQ